MKSARAGMAAAVLVLIVSVTGTATELAAAGSEAGAAAETERVPGPADPTAGGPAPCPAAQQVEAELARIGGAASVAEMGRSDVTVADGRMHIELRDSAGTVLGTRDMEAPTDCTARAAVAAAVLAAWAKTWTESFASVSQSATRPTVARSPAPDTERTPRRWEIAALGGAHHDGDRAAYGVGLSLGAAIGRRLGVALIGDFVGERRAPLAVGAATYSSGRIGAGLTWTAARGAIWADLGIFPQLTWLSAAGAGFSTERSSVLWGAAGQMRGRVGFIAARTGRMILAPFLATSATRAFTRERLTLDDVPDDARLSPWNVMIAGGIALNFDSFDSFDSWGETKSDPRALVDGEDGGRAP